MKKAKVTLLARKEVLEKEMAGALEIALTSFEAWKAYIEFRKPREVEIAGIVAKLGTL